jgi:hypothetical protein
VVPQVLSPLVKGLGREGTLPDPGRVRLANTQDGIELVRADPQTGAYAAGRGVGGGDERIGAVVHIQEDTLGAFEQDRPPLLKGIIQEQRHIPDKGAELLGIGRILPNDRFRFEEFFAMVSEQDVLFFYIVFDLGPQEPGVEKVTDLDPLPVGLVHVGRADAPAGGPDLLFALLLPQAFDHGVVRKDEVGIGADEDVVPDLDPHVLQDLFFPQEGFRTDDHAVAQQAEFAAVQDTGGDQVKDHLAAVDIDGVAGVMPPLIAGHDIEGLGEQIRDLALAFIPPLHADNGDIAH